MCPIFQEMPYVLVKPGELLPEGLGEKGFTVQTPIHCTKINKFPRIYQRRVH